MDLKTLKKIIDLSHQKFVYVITTDVDSFIRILLQELFALTCLFQLKRPGHYINSIYKWNYGTTCIRCEHGHEAKLSRNVSHQDVREKRKQFMGGHSVVRSLIFFGSRHRERSTLVEPGVMPHRFYKKYISIVIFIAEQHIYIIIVGYLIILIQPIHLVKLAWLVYLRGN